MKFSNRLLSEVAFFQEGPGVRKFQFRNEGVKLLNVGNINKGVLDTSTTKLYISEEEAYGKYKHFLVDEGDLLIASSGIVVDNFHNKIAYVKKEHLPLCLNTSTIRFKTLDENVFSLDYLKFYLKTTHFKNQLRKLITGAAQLNFGPSHLKKITLPVPSLPDQLHIANLLSKAENLIAQRKESIRLLDEFLKSTFLEMFGEFENDTPLESFCVFSQGIQVPVEEQYSECKDGQVRFLRIIDFTQSDEPRYIDNLGERYFVSEDDISMVRYGASAGFVGYGKKGIIANNLFKFNFDKKKVLPIYLVQVLQSQRFKNYIKLKSTGSAMPALSFGMLNDYKISIPPIKLQTQFAQIVEKTEALKTQYQQSLQELENLYGSLSQKAFRGELEVKKATTV